MKTMNWTKVWSSTFENDVYLKQQLLERNKIPAITMNKQDSMFLTVGEIVLYVPKEQLSEAFKLIKN